MNRIEEQDEHLFEGGMLIWEVRRVIPAPLREDIVFPSQIESFPNQIENFVW